MGEGRFGGPRIEWTILRMWLSLSLEQLTILHYDLRVIIILQKQNILRLYLGAPFPLGSWFIPRLIVRLGQLLEITWTLHLRFKALISNNERATWTPQAQNWFSEIKARLGIIYGVKSSSIYWCSSDLDIRANNKQPKISALPLTV